MSGASGPAPPALPSVSRRRFIQGTFSLATVGAVAGVTGPSVLVPSALADQADPVRAWAMAMHVHSCFSEGTASMESQLDQAAQTGVDVLWWSEHEFRMQAAGARQVVHFNAASEAENGISWTWAAASTGTLTEKSATYVTSPVSPADPSGGTALHLVGRSDDGAYATYRLNASQQNTMTRTSLDGTTLQVDVRPVTVAADGYVALILTLSNRPAAGGQSAGTYTLEYRVGGEQAPGSRVQSGRTGIVTLDAYPNAWTTLTLDPVADITTIWPWVDGRDSSLYTLAVGVGSRAGSRVDAYLDYLRIARVRKSGDEPLAVQAELMAAYAPRYPSVTQHAALEWSMLKQHMNWFGGTLSLPPPTPTPWKADSSSTAITAATQRIHDAGGVASYNHPFGSGTGGAMSTSAQDSARRSLATELIGQRCYGADLLEVGYPVKGGVTIDGYLSLWDALSRNAVFVTGTGVSDDHSGGNWLTIATNFFTWAWASSTDRAVLTAALASGRAFWGNPAEFRGELDLLVDGAVTMGSVDVSNHSSRTLRILATGLPYGSTVEIVRGVVDYAGSAAPDPVTMKTTLPISAFSSGSADVTVDTTTSVFVRVVVRSSSGAVVAGSNPVWLLRSDPPLGIPLARRSAPSGPVGPSASFSWVATLLDVTFDGSGSSPGDTPVATWAWDFGDGGASTDQAPSHSFGAAGTYSVVLVVTDDVGLTDTVVRTVTVAAEVTSAVITHVGSTRINVNKSVIQVTVPAAVQAGDAMLLFLTVNTTARTITLPAGWAQVGEKTSGTQITKVLQRLAGPAEAGTVVKVTLGGGVAKTVLELLAYRGISSGSFATAAGAAFGVTSTPATPASSVATAGSWVVSYWIDKSSKGISAWTAPAGVAVRGTSFGSAGGALSSLSADSGQGLSPGPCGGLVATSNASSTTATTWTVVLHP